MAFPSEQMGPLRDEIDDDLCKFTFQGKWDKIVDFYKANSLLHWSRITSSEDTALHMAINDVQEDTVERVVGIIMEAETQIVNALEIQNERGDTPLHRAAAKGSVRMCECIVEAGQKMDLDLLTITNKAGETPIFLAALHNRIHAVLYLHHASIKYPPNQDFNLLRRKVDGDTILHRAIRGDHFDLTFHIIRLYPHLLEYFNEKGMTPLHVLARKPSSFRSGSHFSWWQKIIYSFIRVDRLKYDPTIRTSQPQRRSLKQERCPENYQTCYEFLASWYSGKKAESDPENLLAGESSSKNVHYENIPQIYATCHEFLAFIFVTLFGLLGFGKTFTNTKETKEKHVWNAQILDELTKSPSIARNIDGGDPGDGGNYGRPASLKITRTNLDQRQRFSESGPLILIAAKNGVMEIVEKILEIFPAAVEFTDGEGKNIVLLAAENRQFHLYQFLLERSFLRETIFWKVDNTGNNVLHLAAKLGQYKPWLIPSAALHMQWDIKWFEFVKKSSSSYVSSSPYNLNEETPEDIFSETHEKLVESGADWMNKTSESCSVVAALIATVAFATTAAVPGGVQDTGHPTLENEKAFEVYAISSLISVFCSVTSVVMFLSLLTSRHQQQDFGKDLPRKLLVALTSMFLSIASMLVSFCTAHFFMVEHKIRHTLPLYFVASLPVALFAIAQLPQYFEFLWATFKNVPPRGWFRVTPTTLKKAQEKKAQKHLIHNKPRRQMRNKKPRR